MKIRTLLIDGNYLLQRSFHGAKNLYTENFGMISGLYGFMTMTRKLIKDYTTTKCIIFWDGQSSGSQRHQLMPEYKANRKNKSWYEKIEMSDSEIKKEQEKEESILKQRKRVQAYAEELFIRQIEIDEIEADDLIATYCIEYNNLELIHIFTNDRDFAQLLDLNITIIFANIDEPVTKENFYKHFGYIYQNALPLKILCGDISDNVSGISGIGLGILKKYIPDFEFKPYTVNDIRKEAKKINEARILEKKKPIKALENLYTNDEKLKLNYRIVNLREPFLNEQAINELEQLALPLNPEGRSSKNLYNMMMEDQFLTVWGSTFVNYISPFYTCIMAEKQLLEDYYRQNK